MAVVELLGARLTRLRHAEPPDGTNAKRALAAAEEGALIGRVQHRLRDDPQVLRGLAEPRARAGRVSGRAADFGAISRRMVPLMALHDHPAAGSYWTVEFSGYRHEPPSCGAW